MTRTIDASIITALEQDQVRMANLVTLYLSSTLRYTDYGHDISHGGNTYDAISGLLSVSDPTETRDLRVNGITLTLSGVDQSFISVFLTQNWVNRRVVLSRAILNLTSMAVIDNPIVMFDGLITGFDIDEGDNSCEVSVSIASHWADFEKKAGRFTNNNSQQYYFAGDLGMEFAANTVSDIKWGKR